MDKQHFLNSRLKLKKGKKIQILFQLFLNSLLHSWLRLKKKMLGVDYPIVHYYALCWNEEKILPFVFDYYDAFVQSFYFYDNDSTDNSEQIIRSKTNAMITKFHTEGNDNTIKVKIKNNCWKKSRGKADYVIVCDMDEFIFHPQMKEFLLNAMKQKKTLFHPHGYEMYAESYPMYKKGCLLTEIVKRGVPSEWYDKCILFDPCGIVEINYEPGAHKCFPLGCINEVCTPELKLLHYKNIGVEDVIERYRIYLKRQSLNDKKQNFSTHYKEKEESIRKRFEEALSEAEVVV